MELLPDLAAPVALRLVLGGELEHVLDLVERLRVEPVEHVGERVELLQPAREDLGRVAQERAQRPERLARRAVLAVLERGEEDGAERVGAGALAGRDALVRQERRLDRLDERVDLVAEDGRVGAQRCRRRRRVSEGANRKGERARCERGRTEHERLVLLALDVVGRRHARDPVLRAADLGRKSE